MARQIMLLPARCLACGACELACVHQWRTTRGVADARPRVRVRPAADGALPLQCRHCHAAPCVDACPAGAMQQVGDQVRVDTERCIGCWSCVMVCPTCQVMPGPAGPAPATADAHPQPFALKCDGCPGEPVPPCIAACPTAALVEQGPREMAGFLGARRQAFAARVLGPAAEETALQRE